MALILLTLDMLSFDLLPFSFEIFDIWSCTLSSRHFNSLFNPFYYFGLIIQDTVFCKSILNEFAVKMNLELPAYSTRQSEALLPVFVSSLVFNGVTYTGEPGRSKKEAEQLAARAVIRTLLGIF